MASLNEIIYNLKNLPYSGFTSDDTNVTDEQLAFIIRYMRARFLKQAIERGRTRGLEPFIQDLGAVPFSLVDKSECLEITTDCDILRSDSKIPVPIHADNNVMLTAVQTLDSSISFSKTYLAAAKWWRYNKYTPKVRKWYYKNGYVYITNEEEIEVLNIRGIFEDPKKAGEFKICDGKPCWSPDDDYPIAGWMVDDITKAILRGEAATLMGTVADTKNNNLDDKGGVQPKEG